MRPFSLLLNLAGLVISVLRLFCVVICFAFIREQNFSGSVREGVAVNLRVFAEVLVHMGRAFPGSHVTANITAVV